MITTAKQFRIRRALLRALAAYELPQDLNTIMDYRDVVAEAVGVELVEREWQVLFDAGYLLGIAGRGYAYAKLADHIRKQIEAGSSMRQDALLWPPNEVWQ